MPTRKRHSYFNTAPWIKICGLTDPETAKACAGLGADAVGLVFFEKSPRNLTMAQAAAISSALPPSVLPIGVFVNKGFKYIMETVKQCGLKGVQLHGSESPGLVKHLVDENLMVAKALFSGKAPLLTAAAAYSQATYLLVECGRGILPGGNAETWDYRQSATLCGAYPVILAGGLHPGNVAEAVRTVLPAAVDVSSGVEKAPGVKDIGKIKAFIQAVRP